MNTTKLKKILELHTKWLDGEEGGKKANFNHADLQDVDLEGANLRYADLRDASLNGADFEGVDLRRANF